MLRSLAAAMLALMLAGCESGVQCENRIRQTLIAPDGLHGAVLFTRDCGATTAMSTQLSLLSAGEEIAGTGNAYIADAAENVMHFDGGGPWADARWLDNNHLRVRYAPGCRIFKQEEEMAGVTIRYEDVRR